MPPSRDSNIKSKIRHGWVNENMVKAIKEVTENKMGCLKASKLYNVPRSTLQRKIKLITKGKSVEETCTSGLCGIKPVFTIEQQKEIVEYILDIERRFFDFNMTDLRSLAFELAEKNGLPNTFNKETKLAGKKWLHNFLKDNPELKNHTPEATILARTHGFNKISVQTFYNLLEEIYEDYNITPERIYNVDHTEVSTQIYSESKLFSFKNKDKNHSLNTGDNDKIDVASVSICMSAVGKFMPLTFIFSKNNMNCMSSRKTLPYSFIEYNDSGQMEKEEFLKWFTKFIEFTNPTEERPVMLLLDGHKSFMRHLEIMRLARENNVILVSFPPRCAHRLQPLDVTFMDPLKIYYVEELSKWKQNNPNKNINIYEIAELFISAFSKAANIETAIFGFRKTGIHPLNSNIL